MSADPFDPSAPPPTPSADPALKPDQPRASDPEPDEEERRRAGRGGGMNPANASHSFNIRPDVAEGPAGFEVYTTMKSADYRVNASLKDDVAEAERGTHQDLNEPSNERADQSNAATHDVASPDSGSDLEADLLAAEASAHDDDPQHEQVNRTNEESAKRQDVERAARSGEDVPSELASSTEPSLAADLRAAEEAAQRDAEGDGHEATFRDQADGGDGVSKGGERGIF